MANGTATADDATQGQTFDPVAELRNRYPGIANEPDEKVIKHLSDPNNFRSAFPEYAHVDDATITKNMNKRSAVVTPPTEENLPGLTEKGRENIHKGVAPMVPPTKFEKERPPESEGLLSQGLGVVGRQLKDIAASTVAPYTKGYEAYQAAQKAGTGTIGSIGAGVGRGLLAAVPGDPYGQAESALHAPEEYKQRREAGYGPVYSALAPQAAGAVGVNLPKMEEEAAKGHMGGVAMEAAVPAGEALAGEATRIPAVKKAMAVPGKVADFVARGTPMTEAGKLEAAKSQAMVAAKPPGMNETEYAQRVSAAMPDLQRVAQENKGQIRTPRDASNAITNRIKQMEAPIAEQLATQTNPADRIQPEEYQQQVMQAVDQALASETKSYRPKDIEKARNNIAELIGDEPRSQQKIEADRRTLNDEAEKFYKSNPVDQHGILTSDTLAVAQKAAADKIRELQYGTDQAPGFFERAGIKAVDSEGQQVPLADFRRKVGNLIEVRDHFHDAIVRAEQSGDWKPFGPLFKGPSIAAGGIGAAAGLATGGPIGALFGTLAGEGAKAWGSYLTSKNPNLNTIKMFRNLEGTTPQPTTDIRTTPFPGGQGAVRGALAAPATQAGFNQPDTSGVVRGGRWTTPIAQLPETATAVPRRAEAPPAEVPATLGNIPATAAPEATRPTRLGNIGDVERRTGTQEDTGQRRRQYEEKDLPGLVERTKPVGAKETPVYEGTRERLEERKEAEKPEVKHSVKPMTKPTVTEETKPETKPLSKVETKETESAPSTQSKPVRQEYKPEEIEEARLLIRSALDTMASADKPGRYFAENPEQRFTPQREQSASKGVTSGGHWYGVKSLRNQLPWIKDHPEWSPSMLERALKSGDGNPTYEKAVRSAVEFIKAEKESPEEKTARLAPKMKSFENFFSKTPKAEEK